MVSSVLRGLGHLGYRFGLGPQPSDIPDHRLAVEAAQRRADAEGLPARFILGDVTRLSELDIDDHFYAERDLAILESRA